MENTSCIFLSTVGFIISLCLILSLIPLYLDNHSVQKSNTIYPVYTLDQLSFTIGSNTAKQIRTVRDINSSSYLPTESMTASIQQQLNNLLRIINAAVVVSRASMSSTSKLSLILKLYFLEGCIACDARERKLIKTIFNKGLTLHIHTEYYRSCVLDPIEISSTEITLDNDISDSNGISSPTRTLISSLVEQGDPCPNRPALIYPTDCNETQALGLVTSMLVNDGTFQYYCYYFVTPASASIIELQFVFSTDFGNGYALLDNVTLNSTENLIFNGDFQINNATALGYQYQWSSWTSSACEQRCITYPGDLYGLTDFPSFLATGTGITLSQTVAINTVGRQFVYRLGFWFQCIIKNGNPTELCPVLVTLLTT